MIENRSITELMRQRFSCRKFQNSSIPEEMQQQLKKYLAHHTIGPFGSIIRFELIAAEEADRKALRGLGTYGFIKSATGFIIGAIAPGNMYHEDYGYVLEQIVLEATRLGLGTCWLGGTFTKSSFARKIELMGEERLPAVIAIGLIEDEALAKRTIVRASIGSDRRYDWGTLFFDEQGTTPLSREKAGAYEQVLEMVRIAPSASNKQPWRIVLKDGSFHFYLKRTKGYRNPLMNILSIEDMQRLDLGIAMCHFDLAARSLGLDGNWLIQDPSIEKDELTEYCFSWQAK